MTLRPRHADGDLAITSARPVQGRAEDESHEILRAMIPVLLSAMGGP